jgi:hypothetical protein
MRRDRERKRTRVDDPKAEDPPLAISRCRYCLAYATTLDVKQVPDPSGGECYWAVECPGCEARGPIAIKKGLAIKYWQEGITHEYPRRVRKGEFKHATNGHLPHP